MRYVRLALTLVFALVATPLLAAWYPGWSTTDVQVAVGEKVRVRVLATWSGFIIYPGDTGPHGTFSSDNPAIATGRVGVDGTAPQDFDITGVSPGVAHIRQDGTNFSYVTVTVDCGRETPAIAANPVVQAEVGHVVWLTIVTEYQNRSTFRWYLGKIGDTSHPLDRSSFDAPFVPDSYGTHYIWAQAATLCSTSEVQFRVETFLPRKRAVSH